MENRDDPITMEVIRNALGSIADEMALVIMRTAYSAIVRDSMDYSTGVCDRDGRVVAHGLTMALHLGSFPDAMNALLDEYRGRFKEGDIYIFNDPYVAGGMHLPDVYIVKPIFVDGTVEGFAATVVHQIDVGGIAPGSTAVYAREIHQEGLRLPVLKLYDGGVANETCFKLLALNTRIPDKLAGDMRAQVAACQTAEKAYVELVRQHGPDRFRQTLESLHDYADRMMRAEVSTLPDGTWSFTDYIDGLGEHPVPIALQVSVSIAGDEISVDWSGSSPEVPGAINCPAPFVKSATQLILKCIAESDIPNFEGFRRCIQMTIPEGTIVNPRAPAACAARAIVGWRAIDALLGVFAQIVPEKVPSAGEGGVSFPAFSGTDRGVPFVLSETLAGSWGAMHDGDGEFGIPNPGGNITNQPVEMIEAHYPLEICRYGAVPDTGGPGEFRGAASFVREYRIRCDEARVVMRSDRRSILPYSIGGGCHGTPSWNIVNPGPDQKILPVMPMEAVVLKRGDVFTHISAGGAGRGDPLDRLPARVLDDVIEERITPAYAKRVYGVEITGDPVRVDEEETKKCRAALRADLGGDALPAYLDMAVSPLGIEPLSVDSKGWFRWADRLETKSVT